MILPALAGAGGTLPLALSNRGFLTLCSCLVAKASLSERWVVPASVVIPTVSFPSSGLVRCFPLDPGHPSVPGSIPTIPTCPGMT